MGVRVELDGCIGELLNGEDERSEEFGSAVVKSTMADKVRSAESGGKEEPEKMFHVEHKFLRFHYWRELLGKNGAKATALQTPARGTWLRNEDRAYVVTRPALSVT